MGVDLVAIYDKNDKTENSESISQLLNRSGFWFGKKIPEWNIGIEPIYIENESAPAFIRVGNKALGVWPTIRWHMFCENTNSVYVKSISYFIELANLFECRSILFVPDTSYKESKALDLLDDGFSVSQIAAYLNSIGSFNCERENIIKIKENRSVSNGYILHELRL